MMAWGLSRNKRTYIAVLMFISGVNCSNRCIYVVMHSAAPRDNDYYTVNNADAESY